MIIDVEQWTAADFGLAGSSGFIATSGILVVAAGVVLGAMPFVGGDPPERGLEGALGAAALGAVVAAPGVLALLALRERPGLLLPAATALLPLAFSSFSGVTLPLLVPAVMLFVAYRRRSSTHRAARGRAVLATASVLAFLLAAVVALFLHDDPRQWSSADGGGSTGDVITVGESLISLWLTVGAVATGWLLVPPAAGRQRQSRSGSTCPSGGRWCGVTFSSPIVADTREL